MTLTTLKAGDFTGLDKDYSQHRPDYCPSVIDALLGLLGRPISEVNFVDVGAGTGIWKRMVYDKGVKSTTAVEPNDDMRANGAAVSVGPVENMPILYKFSIFRSAEHKKFDENKARAEGYRLSWFGQRLQNFLMRFFPDQFCNIYVLIASKV